MVVLESLGINIDLPENMNYVLTRKVPNGLDFLIDFYTKNDSDISQEMLDDFKFLKENEIPVRSHLAILTHDNSTQTHNVFYEKNDNPMREIFELARTETEFLVGLEKLAKLEKALNSLFDSKYNFILEPWDFIAEIGGFYALMSNAYNWNQVCDFEKELTSNYKVLRKRFPQFPIQNTPKLAKEYFESVFKEGRKRMN